MNLVSAKKNIRSFFMNGSLYLKELKKSSGFIINNFIDNKYNKGFVVINNLKTNNYKAKIIEFAKSIGSLRVQNREKDKIIKVTPKKNINKIKNQLNKIRYHQTNIGGSIHTDGPQLNKTPKYLIMGCYKNSKNGGETLISDSSKIYNFLKKNNPQLLDELCKNIYFERRGFGKKKNYCFKKPIFSKKNNELVFRYLREYIYGGFYLKKKKINKNLEIALNYLDRLMSNSKYKKKIKLSDGDIILINNHRFAHGRTAFKVEKNNSRLIYRIWVD